MIEYLRWQHALLDDVLVVLGPVLLGFNVVLESLRLFFGYLGNLTENVSPRSLYRWQTMN